MSGSALDYIPRIRAYYKALGYGKPYEWAQLDTVPFARLSKPVSDARIGIVTTAAIYKMGAGDQGPGAPHNGSAKFFEVYANAIEPEPDVRISHIAYDRVHTTARDRRTYFPLRALLTLQKEGVIGEVSPRFYGLPTNRSQRVTREVDAPEVVKYCREDDVDAVVLVPNCPVCHQSVALAASVLEAEGIPTVILGCAKDIVEHVGVPRLLFNNFPLGNGAGLPHDRDSQVEIARMAVEMLETAESARTTRQSPFEWSGAEDWQKDYSNPDMLNREEIARRRAAFDAVKDEAKVVKTG
jgi:glycine/betaine/sarcosine/D-proline reductase family selenoprotein B